MNRLVAGLLMGAFFSSAAMAQETGLAVRLQNERGVSFGTPANPINVTGGGGSTGSVTPAGTNGTQAQAVQGIGGGVPVPVSAQSLPLPTGAATAAKQPAPGTAGASSADVLSIQGVAGGTPQNVNDPNNASYTASTPITPGTAFTAKRAVWANCTVAGTATVTMSGGGTVTWAVGVGFQQQPFAATNVTLAAGTCSFGALN